MGTTDLGRTNAQHRSMLGHLVTIGTALNAASWPDDLQRIHGIGPRYEAILHGEGVTTFEQLNSMDADTRARVERALDEFPSAALDEWIEAAAPLTQEAPQEAETYLADVQRRSGRPIKRDGTVTTVVRNEDRRAVLERFNAFDAPTDYPPVGAFVEALGAFVAATNGTARIPKFDVRHLETLQAAYASLDPEAN